MTFWKPLGSARLPVLVPTTEGPSCLSMRDGGDGNVPVQEVPWKALALTLYGNVG